MHISTLRTSLTKKTEGKASNRENTEIKEGLSRVGREVEVTFRSRDLQMFKK